jgi:fibronectin type 3 domain-containing protein
LAATPSNHLVSLTWNTTTTASSYNVKHSTASGGPYTHVANATVSNDTDTGLANGTTYYYVLSAVNANGESANSSEVSRDSKHPASRCPHGADGDRGQPASGSCLECHHGSDEL